MSLSPKQLFLLDGLGALLSTFLLGFVLVKLEYLFGMPQKELYFLASIPFFFAIYDFICYWKIQENWRPYLKAIAIANLLYCCVSVAFVFHSYHQLTSLGFGYFILELIIVIIIGGIELKKVYEKN